MAEETSAEAAEDAEPPPLPAGWRSAHDDLSNRFYWHIRTREATFTRPAPPAEWVQQLAQSSSRSGGGPGARQDPHITGSGLSPRASGRKSGWAPGERNSRASHAGSDTSRNSFNGRRMSAFGRSVSRMSSKQSTDSCLGESSNSGVVSAQL